jgi:D-alanine-D-alanine ligase
MQNIGVFFGGVSPEHDISIITGQTIISGLKKIGYNIIPVYINKKGEWLIDEQLAGLKFFLDKDYESKTNNFKGFYLDVEDSCQSGKIIFKNKKLFGNKFIIDLAFPAFHGINGEDGSIQGLFEIINIPYVGCDVSSSGIAIDKILTKLIYLSQNILTSKFLHFNKIDWEDNKQKILAEIQNNLKLPLFIKPARLGSSIGINKAETGEELEFAIEVALHYDNRILIEEKVNNLSDITCSIIGNEKLIASEIQESAFKEEFLTYEEKYLNDGGTQLGSAEKNIIIPAHLDENISEEVKNISKKIYKTLGCSGIARIDFLYDKIAKRVYANEVNTLPGTLYHHLWKASGIEFEELLKKLISYALEKNNEKKLIKHTFDSDILSMAKSYKLQLNK